MVKNSKVSLSIISCFAFALCASAADAITITTSQGQRPTRTQAYNQMPSTQARIQYEQQMAEQEYNAQQAAIAAMPVVISDPMVADSVKRGDDAYGVNMTDIDACAAIFPNGKMVWDRPNAGLRQSGTETCSVIIEMRAISGNSDIVLGTAIVAAGDAIDCNIGSFPVASYTTGAGEIVFPADKEPTMTDVEKVMNEEQKQNAALKIAAGAVVGALGGNFTGASNTGAMLGTNKEKMQNTVVGALAGAGLMTANAYTGKVVGDTVLSTGVNAAMGAAIGNMAATGRALLVRDCIIDGQETECLYGVVQRYDPNTEGTRFYNLDTGDTILCKNVNADGFSSCELKRVIGFTVNDKYIEDLAANNFYALRNDETTIQFCLNAEKNTITQKGVCPDTWVMAQGGGVPISPVAAMIPNTGMKFGTNSKDFITWKQANRRPRIYERKQDGTPGKILSEGQNPFDITNFYPTYQDASDGGIIDFNNRARTKATLIGAGAGGALGGFSGYMGAINEVEQRWVSAVTTYKDSLQKIYCGTGTRFLGQYNDLIIVPNMKKENK